MKARALAMTALLGALLVLLLPGVALADGGPHGNYRDAVNLTDACAGCHRVHQGLSSGKLLKAESQYALCLTCHNGAGSALNVLDGVRQGGPGYTPAALIALDSGVVPRSNDTTNMYVSLAPYGDLSASPGKDTYITVRIKNKTAAPLAAALAAADTPRGGTPAAAFAAADFVDVTAATPASSNDAENPGNPTATVINSVVVPANDVAYVRLRTRPAASAATGNSILTTVSVAAGGQTATVKAQTRVGDQALPVLNGGGFNYVGAKAATSRHNANPADNSLNPWGYAGLNQGNYAGGGTGKGANTGENPNALAEPLQCTSCHNPHGTPNYRLLKASINGNPVDVKAFYGGLTANEGARGLEAGAPADKYVKEYYGSQGNNGAGFASFCGSCHTAYPSDGASLGVASTSSFGAVLHYRHRTEMPYTNWTNPNTGAHPQNPETNPLAGSNGTFPPLRLASGTTQDNTVVTCLTCHRVHGSDATMTGWALKQSLGGQADEGITPSQINESRSSLIYMDNRGMCEACHQW